MSSPLGIHAGQYRNEFSEAENRSFAEVFGAITSAMAEAMSAGHPPTSSEVQSIVARHYAFCSQFWSPTQESYKALAMSYLLPTEYRESYESVATGLAKYHYDAIVEWADAHLSSGSQPR